VSVEIDLSGYMPTLEPFRIETPSGFVWVAPSGDGLVSAVVRDRCAHMGAQILPTRTGWRCPLHHWGYFLDGSNIDKSLPGLEKVEFEYNAPHLTIHLGVTSPLFLENGGSLTGEESLELLSHASFLLSAGGSRVLFDPWLVGEAYWGSWVHFPQERIHMENFPPPTHIVITHPHPDHFHKETLAQLPRNIPVFFPDFPSGIIQEGLKDLGFTNLRMVDWEVPVSLDCEIEFAFLRPTSYWEDSAVLVRVSNWIWLNQNDAGAVLDDALLPKEIDLLTASFDVGASGYPLTWGVPEQKSKEILRQQASNLLDQLRGRCEATNSRCFGPSASYWRLGSNPGHLYSEFIPHNNLAAVEAAFASSPVRVLKTIPGSKLNLRTMEIIFSEVSFSKMESDSVERDNCDERTRNNSEGNLVGQLTKHLSALATMSYAVRCEEVMFTVVVPELAIRVSQRFGLGRGEPDYEISVEVPAWVAHEIVSSDSQATWHHFDIGYWCKWTRSPDQYAPGFTRLVRLGYVPALKVEAISSSLEVSKLSIAKILEDGGEVAASLLKRSGLACSSCNLVNSETLEDAIRIHSIPHHNASLLQSGLWAAISS